MEKAQTSTHFLRPCLQRPHAAWMLRNMSTNAPVATQVIRAFDRKARNEGLLRRAVLPPNTAIVLAPCSSVHTCFMRFPIDVLFVDKGGRVVALRRSLAPWRIALRWGAFAVIEMAAGATASIDVGDRLGVEPAPADA